MKLLIDQNLPHSLIDQLVELGHDAIHTSDEHLDRAPGPVVFAACVENDRVLATADKKLTKFMAFSNATEPSIIVMRGFSGGT